MLTQTQAKTYMQTKLAFRSATKKSFNPPTNKVGTFKTNTPYTPPTKKELWAKEIADYRFDYESIKDEVLDKKENNKKLTNSQVKAKIKKDKIQKLMDELDDMLIGF